jgi:hypothetical protein
MFSMNYSTWHFRTVLGTPMHMHTPLLLLTMMRQSTFGWPKKCQNDRLPGGLITHFWCRHYTVQQMSAIGLLKHHSLHSCHIHKRNAPSNFMSSIDCFRSCSSLVVARYHLPVVPTCGVWMSPFAFRSPSAFTETKDPANTKTPSFLMMVHWM